MRARGTQLALLVVIAIVFIPFTLVLWAGPALYGLVLLRDGHDVLGAIVVAVGVVWFALLLRDKVLPGMLFGAVHSLLIVAGLAKDPWEDPEYLAALADAEAGARAAGPPAGDGPSDGGRRP